MASGDAKLPTIRPSPTRWVAPVLLFAIVVFAFYVVADAIWWARNAARQTEWKNALKQIGLALLNYHDTFQKLPPGGVFQADGTPMVGWTSSIWPFIDSNRWNGKFDFNIPWDDPRQIDFYKSMHPPAFRDFRLPESEARHHGLPVSHMAANQWLMHRNSSVPLTDITSGTSNTMMMANAAGEFAPIGEPHNWRDPEEPLLNSAGSFGYPGASVTCYLMADGSVHWVDSKIDPRVLAPMAGPPELRPSREQVAKPPGAWYPGRR